jgi:hypothetical protein
VTAWESSRENREATGEATLLEGNGYASEVSRRRLPGRVVVGEESPYGVVPPCETDVLRSDRPSFGGPSLFVFCAGGLRGELTDDEKF